MTAKDGSTVTWQNDLFYKKNLTVNLNLFDPNQDDPEVQAFRLWV